MTINNKTRKSYVKYKLHIPLEFLLLTKCTYRRFMYSIDVLANNKEPVNDYTDLNNNDI